MENTKIIGYKNEAKAKAYLIENGFKIITTNFMCRYGEIDIVGRDEKYLVFVEVKFRNKLTSGNPLEAVDFRKRKKISDTALYYIFTNKIDDRVPIRFDVVDIYKDKITHIKNAFYIGE